MNTTQSIAQNPANTNKTNYYQLLEILVSQLKSVLFLYDADGRCIFITESVKEMLGYESNAFYQIGFWESLVHPEDIVLIQELYEKLQVLDEFKILYRIKKASGEYIHVYNTATVQRYDTKVEYITGTIQEVSLSDLFKKTEVNNQVFLEQLFDNLGLMFYAIDTNYKLVAKNKIFDDILQAIAGHTIQIGSSVFENTFNDVVNTLFKENFDKCFKGGQVQDYYLDNTINLHYSMAPVKIGNTVEAVAVMQLDKSKEAGLLNKVSQLHANLENIINSTDEWIYAIDCNYCFLAFNNAYKKLYYSYYSTYPIIGEKNISIEKDGFVKDNLWAWYTKAFNGESVDIDEMLDNRIINVRIRPVINNQKQVTGISVYSRDITAQKQAQLKLQESEKKYKQVVDNINDVIFQTNAAGDWTFLNAAWAKVMEFTIEESIGQPFFNFLHPDDVEKNQQLFIPLINRQKPYCTHEIRYLTKSKKVKWIKVYATLILDEDDVITGTSGTLTDVTEEKRNSYMYRLLSENIMDIVCLHETDWTFLYVSPAMKTITGYDTDDIIGVNPIDYLHPDDKERITAELKETYEAGHEVLYNSGRFRMPDGTYKWFETNTRSIFDEFYNRNLLITSSRIIDERKEAEQKILAALEKEKQLGELKSRFVNMASHEFRTPMTTIKSSAEIAAMYLEGFTDEKLQTAKSFLKTVDQEIDRLADLIGDILLIGKIESNQFKPNFQPIDLLQLIENCIQRQQALQEDGRKVRFSVIGFSKIIRGDKTQLSHVIDNLISNAFKYSKGKPDPCLTLFFNANDFHIKIQDFGIGIPLADQPRIFDSFFRAKNTNGILGTGIGLVLVENFVAQHGGKITFNSVEGDGTLFNVTIPYLLEQ